MRSLYKLRTKAILGNIVKLEYTDNTPRLGKPKASIATALFILKRGLYN
jgi:hypothetical protein